MNFISRLTRSIRKRICPTEREVAIKEWRRNQGDLTLRLNYPLQRSSLVLDLGGYEGSWAAEIFSRYSCQIDVFEPVATFAENIESRFSGNSSIRVHVCGLGGSTRKEEIYLESDASSVFKKGEGPHTPIDLIAVDQWFDENDIGEVDLIKINIEGGEYELLERMLEKDLVRKVRFFQIQFHELGLESRERMKAIRAGLAKTHRADFHYPFVWDGWSRKDS